MEGVGRGGGVRGRGQVAQGGERVGNELVVVMAE